MSEQLSEDVPTVARGLFQVVWILVQGVQDASEAWSALARWGPRRIPEPAYLGDRWWLMAAQSPLPLNGEIVAAVSGAQRALVLTQESTESWSVPMVLDAVSTTVSVDPRGPIDPVVAEFSRASPGRQVGPRMRRSPQMPLPLKDAGVAWLKRCGWPMATRIDPTRILKGAQAANPSGVAHVPPMVAERRISSELTRWVMDRQIDAEEDRYALWDRDRPGESPLMHWPFTLEGRAAAQAEFNRRVTVPILEASILEGQRFWAPAPRLNDESRRCGAVIAHWHPRGTITVIQPWLTPVTELISPVGWIPISQMTAQRLDPDAPPGVQEVLLDGVDAGLRIARIFSHPFELGQWQEIPDSVPRALLGTCEWVRSQALAEGFA